MSTTNHAEKRSARELQRLTDLPYQACLSAVRVIWATQDEGIDIGELEEVLTDPDRGRRATDESGDDPEEFEDLSGATQW